MQAAISALHAEAATPEATDWRQIAELYRVLAKMHPSPVVEVNRAVAVGMAEGANAGLRLLYPLAEAMDGYYPYHMARADFLRRTNQREAAAVAYAQESTASTGSGTLTFNGVTYEWQNYEQLQDLLTYVVLPSNDLKDEDGDLVITLNLALNAPPDLAAPVAIYCTPSGIEIWDISSGGQGTFALSALSSQLLDSETYTGLGNMPQGLGNGQAQVIAPYDYPGAPMLPPYMFTFDLALCAGNEGAQLN